MFGGVFFVVVWDVGKGVFLKFMIVKDIIYDLLFVENGVLKEDIKVCVKD